MGVVNIKKKYLLVLITVLFISLTVVSATNDTDIEEKDSGLSLNQGTSTHNTELITKKTTDNVTKTSTTTNTKTASKTSVNPVTTKYNSTVKLSAKITNAKTGNNIDEGKVVFKVNGNTVGYSNVDNGLATYVYDAKSLTPKNYTITVKYGENSKYLGSSSTSTLTVVKDASKIVVSNVTVISNETVKITATVSNKNNGNYATSGKVAFKLNGKTIGYANVTNGKAILTYKAVHSAKTYKLNATYGGNNILNSSVSSMSSFVVSPRPTKMTVGKISGYSTTVVLKASVVDKLTSKNLTSGLVVFKINDKTVGNATISKGVASLKYNSSHLARGTYKLTALLKPTSVYDFTSVNTNLTILAESSFTYDQIKTAAVYVRTVYESNNTLTTVPIGKSRIALSEFLALMIKACVYADRGVKVNISYKKYNSLNEQYDSMAKVVLNISQVKEIGDRTLSFMEANGRPPKYVSTDFGKMGYFNIVYTYCRVMDVSAYNYLPSTCRVYSWASMHPASSKSRTIYLTSDVIVNKEVDYAFMESIKKALNEKGYSAVVLGYGPNSHNTAIRSQSLPINAVQVSIFGGADPGVLYDMSTRSFMKLKESRLMYLVFHSTYSKDITGLSFLKRARDDTYSPSSFTGIANPDKYLRSYGYDYVFTNNINTIVNGIIKYIS